MARAPMCVPVQLAEKSGQLASAKKESRKLVKQLKDSTNAVAAKQAAHDRLRVEAQE